jgi:phage baseplate assembly protein gpV
MAANLQNTPLTNRMPNESKDFRSAFEAVLNLHSKNQHKLLPAQILEYDRALNQATVKPMIMFVDVANNSIPRNQIASIPVMSMGGGGFHISFPLKEGDLGWIVASDRDISLFIQSLKEAAPNTLRHHHFGDAMFMPDVFRNYTINAEDDDATVIQSTDGTIRISLSTARVKVTHPTLVIVDAPTAQFTKDVEIGQNLTVAGNTQVNGGLDASGSSGAEVTLPANTTIGNVNVLGHGHEQNGDSGRTSGGMEA